MQTTPSTSRRRHYRFILLGLLLIGMTVAAGVLWWQTQHRYTITITINGTVHEFSTNADTVAEALEDADVLIDRADRIEPDTQTPLRNGMTITVIKAQQLVLDYDGEIQRIYTHEKNPYRILDEQHIALQPNDKFLVNYRPAEANGGDDTIRHLQIISAKRYQILEGDVIIAEGASTAPTIGALLAELEIPLYMADEISPSLDQAFADDLVIQIKRSIPVQIEADGRRINTRAVGSTINDAVNSAGFPLSGQDYTIPAPDASLTPNVTIQIIRVLESVEEQRMPMPYRTFYYPNPNLPIGQQEVIQVGAEGVQVSQVRIRYENGQVVSRVASVPSILQPPVPHIIAYGVQ